MKINHKVEPLDFQAVTITTVPGPADEDVDCAWRNVLREIVPALVNERHVSEEIEHLIQNLCGDAEVTEDLLCATLAQYTQQLRISGKALIVECSNRPANLMLCYCEQPTANEHHTCGEYVGPERRSESKLRRLKFNVPVTPQMRALLGEIKSQCERLSFAQAA